MKKYSLRPILLGISMLVLSCSKDSVNVAPQVNTPTPTPPTPVILQPESPILTFPINEEPCLDTNVVDETQSTVTFQWNTALNALSYEIRITNLTTSSEQSFATFANAISVALESAEPYSWKVSAIGEEGSNPADSGTWRFYLPGPAQVNYAPFPPELTSPNSGSTVTAINDTVTLQWNCSDADSDLTSYEVYIDQQDASTLAQTIDHENATTAVDVTVVSGVVYYWKIVAIDAEGNQSDSGVYTFRTN